MTLLLYFAACSIMYLQRPQGCNYINSSCWLERKKVSSTMVPAPHALVLGTKLMKQRANNQRKHKTNVNTKTHRQPTMLLLCFLYSHSHLDQKHTFWGKHTTPSSVKMEIYLSHTYIEGHFFSKKDTGLQNFLIPTAFENTAYFEQTCLVQILYNTFHSW